MYTAFGSFLLATIYVSIRFRKITKPLYVKVITLLIITEYILYILLWHFERIFNRGAKNGNDKHAIASVINHM